VIGTPARPADLTRRLQELLARLETIEDDAARDTAEELVGAMLELYGEGLERIVQALVDAGPPAEPVRRALVDDGAVASLLLIHGLHPVELETRVLEALERVRPYLQSHGGDVELLGLEGDVARLRLQGTCNGCAGSAATLELAIEQALEETAPDLLGIEVEGVAQPAPVSFSGKALPLAGAAAPEQPAWVAIDAAGAQAVDGTVALDVGGVRLLVANVGGTLLAYRDACAGCGEALHGGELEDGVLACPACSRQFVLPLAGRLLGEESLQLTAVPLLAESGSVRVAVGA
jgi:Fe-S cluster biogenesis protein NfuA